jgi:hypothetical protein
MSEWVWTWGGISFGFIDGNALYTHDGRHVAYVNDEGLIFDLRGSYIGELADPEGGRLLTRLSRLGRTRGPRAQRMTRMARMRRMNRVGRVMRVGCRDFPPPEAL